MLLRVEEFLHALPDLLRHERLMRAVVRDAVPIKIAIVNAPPEDLVDLALVHRARAKA